MSNVDSMIQWFKDREGKVTYSMTNRLGPNSYDCSSAVFFALIQGGFLAKGTAIGNTDSLYALEGKILTPISRSSAKRGDIFIAGVKGGSVGSGGHTGVFLDNNTIIHCTYPKNGIATTAANGWMGDASGLPVYYYRLPASTSVNDRPFQTVITGWFSKGGAPYNTALNYINSKGFKYATITGTDGRVRFSVGVFNQDSSNKYALEKFFASNNFGFETVINRSPKASVTSDMRHAVLTGLYTKGGVPYNKVINYVTEKKFSHKIITKSDGRVEIEVGLFVQTSTYKFELQKFLSENNLSYEVIIP